MHNFYYNTVFKPVSEAVCISMYVLVEYEVSFCRQFGYQRESKR